MAEDPTTDDRGLSRFHVAMLCPSAGGACLQIGLTDFPGVDVRFGAWIFSRFPRCGCDACDEQPAQVARDMRQFVAALIGGTCVEWWDGERAGLRHGDPKGWSSGWGVVADDDPRRAIAPYTTQHRAWQRRAT